MKRFKATSGGRKALVSWASQLAFTGAMAASALTASSAAKAAVVETFNLSGKLNTAFPFGSLVPFTGTFELNFNDDFSGYQFGPLTITVQGHSVFRQVEILSAAGSILARNSNGDTLSLSFNASGTWTGFNQGSIGGGVVIFNGNSGLLLGATGVIARDLADPPIIPQVVDPPPITDPPDPPPMAVPELSTWAMMLLGLAGLALAPRNRRALAFLGPRA